MIGAIFVVWSVWMSPSKEEQAEKAKEEQADKKREQDSLMMVQQRKIDSLVLIKAEEKIQELIDKKIIEEQDEDVVDISIVEEDVINKDKFSVFANSSTGENKIFKLENDVLKLKFYSKGGKIYSAELKDYVTYDSLPLILFDADSSIFGFSFFSDNRLINTNDLYFQPYWKDSWLKDKDSIVISGSDSVQFAMRLYIDADETSFNKNRYIEYLYTLRGDKYRLGFTVNFVGMKGVVETSGNALDLVWSADLRKQEKTVDRLSGTTIYYKYYKDDVDYLSETSDDEESLKTKVKWISYKQRFFTSTLIADNYFSNADIKAFTDPSAELNDRYLKSMYSVIGVPYSMIADNQSIPLSFFFGPNKYKILRKYRLDLEEQIPLGWSFFLLAWINIYAVIPVFDFLGSFGWNYGIIILILTILLKLVLFPIAYKTYKSTAKMRVLKPEIDEIAKKFPKKEDAMKKQQATMAFYKKAGVNPMAGCVPMLLQMPILIALFRFFPSSIELRQQSFLWAKDLSSYDSIWTFPNDFSIPFYGDHISLFTLLMTISTIFYTKINNQMMASSSQQMPGMKMMMYLMPIMFLGWFNNYAAGLSYYYLLANLITFGQMFLIKRTIDEEKLLKKIQMNKKKPVKKSGFQKRLEEAAKKRGRR